MFRSTKLFLVLSMVAAGLIASGLGSHGHAQQPYKPKFAGSGVEILQHKMVIKLTDPDYGPEFIRPFNEVLADPAMLENALRSLDLQATEHVDDGGGDSIALLIQALSAANLGDRPLAGMSGLTGMFGRALLDAAERSLTDGVYDPEKRVIQSTHGQIIHYDFDFSKSERKPGKMVAETYISTIRVADDMVLNTIAYRWAVTVNGRDVKLKRINTDASGIPDFDDPFPGTVEFPEDTKLKIKSIGLNTKLWALGTGIRVDSVYRDADYDPQQPDFALVNRNAPEDRQLYISTAESCIDMMFKVGVPGWDDPLPPQAFAKLRDYVLIQGTSHQPGYCLGRCAHPELINTGY